MNLFGTDGIRKKAGVFPITPGGSFLLGVCLGEFFLEHEGSVGNKVLLARDTRESGSALQQSLVAGLAHAGIETISLGVVSTPFLAFAVRENTNIAGGIMITASHNVASDNGFKIFTPRGKLTAQEEMIIEEKFFFYVDGATDGVLLSRENVSAEHSIAPDMNFFSAVRKQYLALLSSYCVGEASPQEVIVDCANGAQSSLAPLMLKEFNISATAINCGQGVINEFCGVTCLDSARTELLEKGSSGAIIFDGDGDRLVLLDEKGELIDGDDVIAFIAEDFLERGLLKNSCVAVTHYSNLGLDAYLSSRGIRVVRVDNGDKFVQWELKKQNLSLGGEQSGHIVFEGLLSGDGLLTAVVVLDILQRKHLAFSDICRITRFPRISKSIPVTSKPPLSSLPSVQSVIAEGKAAFAASESKKGNILVRYSGTEDVLRVLVEAESEELVSDWSKKIFSALKSYGLGGA